MGSQFLDALVLTGTMVLKWLQLYPRGLKQPLEFHWNGCSLSPGKGALDPMGLLGTVCHLFC